MWHFIKGLKLTLKQLFIKPITVQYPKERLPKSHQFRGLHMLNEKCVACRMCLHVCPAKAIDISSELDPETKKRYPVKFNIDLSKCMFCGLCEQACPVNAIIETGQDLYCFYNKEEQILSKEALMQGLTKND